MGLYKAPPNNHWQEAWTTTERVLIEFRDQVRTFGARFLLVVIPEPIRVHPDEEKRGQFAQQVGVESLDYAENRLVAFARSHDIRVLNLAPPLADHATTRNEFLHGFIGLNLGEGHWNETGHEVVTDLLFDALVDDIKSAG